ncbi:flagellar export chaperone FliS [Georgenia sp. 311]|uniref:Flagellar export chaperone FliS n=1 Tax=Georgenia wutianyii TaxID=2585135 RepID=A0ABX5VKG1_9MICO|nr:MULTISPECIES: flagellar export chaperone FliS [Georgenia]QDB78161.1 flagellar export chaperone FliS [Georgenia wutianyii]TNC21264.1 flagellar export chaperone FliS [Georgenia sp. 311]
MNQTALLAKFRRESLATASPAQLLTMLYDRLLLDLDRAVAALEAGDKPAANEQLGHAQEIIHELRCSLDPTVWDGGPRLLDLYNFLYGELVSANVTHDADRVAACRALVQPLRDAWHQAAAMPGTGVTTSTAVG